MTAGLRGSRSYSRGIRCLTWSTQIFIVAAVALSIFSVAPAIAPGANRALRLLPGLACNRQAGHVQCQSFDLSGQSVQLRLVRRRFADSADTAVVAPWRRADPALHVL